MNTMKVLAGLESLDYGTMQLTRGMSIGYLPQEGSAGVKTATIAYHYKIANVPTWANDPQVRTAYPDMTAAITTNPSDQATLVAAGDRWEFQR